jgi:hypothetical protein
MRKTAQHGDGSDAASGRSSPALGERLARGRCKPAGTLLHITSLAFPNLMVEIEATAVE